MQYDSIYVSQNIFTDRSKDSILIRQHDVEYRYKLLRDTIERIKIEVVHDSIPYEVRIETIKEVPRRRSTFDVISYVCFGIYILGVIVGSVTCIMKPLIHASHPAAEVKCQFIYRHTISRLLFFRQEVSKIPRTT